LAIGADLPLIRGWRRHCRWRISPTLRYDAAVEYSGIGYDGTAGTARGDFQRPAPVGLDRVDRDLQKRRACRSTDCG
jgi:hypothetical protein